MDDRGDHADVRYTADAPGAVIAGQDTATVTRYEVVGFDANDNPIYGNVQYTLAANNSVEAYGVSSSCDITQDTITNASVLHTSGVLLTKEQLDAFETIAGSGTISAATSGTYSLAA